MNESFVLVSADSGTDDAARATALRVSDDAEGRPLRILTQLAASAPDLSSSPHTPHTPQAFARIGAALATAHTPGARGTPKRRVAQQQQQQQQPSPPPPEETPTTGAQTAVSPSPFILIAPVIGADRTTLPLAELRVEQQQQQQQQQQQPEEQQAEESVSREQAQLRQLQKDARLQAEELRSAHEAIAQLQLRLQQQQPCGRGDGTATRKLHQQLLVQLPQLPQRPQEPGRHELGKLHRGAMGAAVAAVDGSKPNGESAAAADQLAAQLAFLRRAPLVRHVCACPTVLLLPCALLLLLVALLMVFRVDVGTMASNLLLLTLKRNGAHGLRGGGGAAPPSPASDDVLRYPTNGGGAGSL